MDKERRGEGELRKILDKRIDADPRLAQLSPAKRAEVVRRIGAAAPFRDQKELKQRLASLAGKGLNRQERQALFDVLQGTPTRRRILAAWGLGGLAAAAYGTARLASSSPAALPSSPSSAIRPLLAVLQQRRLSVGQAFSQELAPGKRSNGRSSVPASAQFLHALDMSNWLEAAKHLDDRSLRQQINHASIVPPFDVLISGLEQLRRAWEQLREVGEVWQERFFVAYAFGKLPGLASATPADPPSAAARQLQSLGPLFHALEIYNQKFLPVARTQGGAPVRVTQGHNLSYAHLASDLASPELFAADRPAVLVNWDAHADLGPPFENSRMPLAQPLDMLAAASSFDEQVVVASSMSIGGWIGPLLEQGLLHRDQHNAELVWVVPPEARATSTRYMPAYGTYELLVGKATGEQSLLGEPRIYSPEPRLRKIAAPELLSDVKPCRLHIVSPDDLQSLDTLLDDKQIALSIDVDFAGTREPGAEPRRGFLPHYPLNETPQEVARHHRLIHQAGAFYGRWQASIRSVTIANSPNFTVDEATRHPLAHLLQEIAEGGLQQTPKWVNDELRRTSPERDDLAVWLNRGLAIGGYSSIGLAAALAGRQWLEKRRLHAALLEKR